MNYGAVPIQAWKRNNMLLFESESDCYDPICIVF